MRKFLRRFSRKNMVATMTTDAKWRSILTAIGYYFNHFGILLTGTGRKFVRFINYHLTDESSDRFVIELPVLHGKIDRILKAQKKEYGHYAYFYGYPYQSLGILGIYGERPSEERYDAYKLSDLVNKDDHVLDIGCNCGFMSVLTSYRTGATTHGIDINPYMIDIGRECADFLGLSDKVVLEAKKFQEMEAGNAGPFSVVYSFATHWTDDGNYRVALTDHLKKIHSLMKPGGLLVFESHCADVGDATFYETMEDIRSHFTWDGKQLSDKGERELYLMKAK